MIVSIPAVMPVTVPPTTDAEVLLLLQMPPVAIDGPRLSRFCAARGKYQDAPRQEPVLLELELPKNGWSLGWSTRIPPLWFASGRSTTPR